MQWENVKAGLLDGRILSYQQSKRFLFVDLFIPLRPPLSLTDDCEGRRHGWAVEAADGESVLQYGWNIRQLP